MLNGFFGTKINKTGTWLFRLLNLRYFVPVLFLIITLFRRRAFGAVSSIAKPWGSEGHGLACFSGAGRRCAGG